MSGIDFINFAETVMGSTITDFVRNQLEIDKMSVADIKARLAELRKDKDHSEAEALQLIQALMSRGEMNDIEDIMKIKEEIS